MTGDAGLAVRPEVSIQEGVITVDDVCVVGRISKQAGLIEEQPEDILGSAGLLSDNPDI
jgi:hypothetical protein